MIYLLLLGVFYLLVYTFVLERHVNTLRESHNRLCALVAKLGDLQQARIEALELKLNTDTTTKTPI